MNKILAIIIPALLLSTSYAPAYAVSIKTIESPAVQENVPDKVISHSSFVQIQMPKQIFNMCVKAGKTLRTNMLVSFSHGETVIKSYYQIMNGCIFFCAVNVNLNKNLKRFYPVESIVNSGNTAKDAGGGFIFHLFMVLLILLCLLAVKKANLPYAFILNRNKKARYQM